MVKSSESPCSITTTGLANPAVEWAMTFCVPSASAGAVVTSNVATRSVCFGMGSVPLDDDRRAREALKTRKLRRFLRMIPDGMPSERIERWRVAADPVQAHMWFAVAAAKLPDGAERKAALGYQAIISKKMTLDQIDEAKRLAEEWRALERQ